MVRRRDASAWSFPAIDPLALVATGVLPKPPALQLVERNLGAFDESLPTLKFHRRELSEGIVEIEFDESHVPTPAQPLQLAPESIAAEITTEIWWADVELVDEAPASTPLVDVFEEPSPLVALLIPLMVAKSSPLPDRPRTLVTIRPLNPCPQPAPPAVALMLACWLVAAVLSTAILLVT
ncbi:MAG TPA: hypothetical protein VG755_14605 [Nannocystaceae bacterium]|nr:hypothetical protein [Nannocystaceae bacterium]